MKFELHYMGAISVRRYRPVVLCGGERRGMTGRTRRQPKRSVCACLRTPRSTLRSPQTIGVQKSNRHQGSKNTLRHGVVGRSAERSAVLSKCTKTFSSFFLCWRPTTLTSFTREFRGRIIRFGVELRLYQPYWNALFSWGIGWDEGKKRIIPIRIIEISLDFLTRH